MRGVRSFLIPFSFYGEGRTYRQAEPVSGARSARLMGSIVVISIMILASAGILIGGFLLFRNVFDRIDEKWHDRWQYYKVIGVKSLRKAVTVALCIVSITFALIAGMCIPLDINVVS